MSDLVVRWLSKLTRLSDPEYQRLLDSLWALRPWQLPVSKEAERKRRYRASRRGTLSQDMSGTRPRDKHGTLSATASGTNNGTCPGQTPLEPPVVSSISKSFPAFESFWKAYPKHIGKGEAYKAWKQGNCEAKAEFILTAVGAQMAYFQAQGPKYTPNPATWLNQKRWDDEPPMPSLLGEKTRGNMASLQAFVDGVRRGDMGGES